MTPLKRSYLADREGDGSVTFSIS